MAKINDLPLSDSGYCIVYESGGKDEEPDVRENSGSNSHGAGLNLRIQTCESSWSLRLDYSILFSV